MAIDLKYGEVKVQHDPGFGDDEIVIVFRSQDKLLPAVLADYHRRCIEAGCGEDHLGAIDVVYDAVVSWQSRHMDRIKVPDTPPR